VVDQILIGCGMSVLCGLDRTALLQMMLSRPVVAAPLTGLLLGSVETGLVVGALLELLWLGRLPMGASIPPDDTQIAVAATFLASLAGAYVPASLQMDTTFLALLVAMPLGKVGVVFDHWARRRNAALSERALEDVSRGEFSRLDSLHWRGLFHFVQSALATFLVIAVLGGVLMFLLVPLCSGLLERLHPSRLMLLLPLVGMAQLLANLNVKRALTLFISSFFMVYLVLWLK